MSFTYQDTPDKVYYDITISNLQSIDTAPPILYFNETRNSPFVLDPESYYLSIVRFTLDTPTLPVFQPEIQPKQGDPNLTIYSVTLSWTAPSGATFNSQVYINFAPQVLGAPIPPPPSQTSNGLQSNANGYYFVYNYQYWIYLVNQAFSNAFSQLNTQVTGAGFSLPTPNAPVMSWDITANLAILNADFNGYSNTLAHPISIYFNPALYQLFSSFPAYINFDPQNLGKNALIQTDAFGGANLIAFPPSAPVADQYQALQIVQEYSTIALWSPITSIVFTSNTLPVVPTNISAPLIYIDGSIYNGGGNNSNISQIITDFVSNDGIYKPNIVYQPSAQYRLLNLTGNSPIYNLDINVYWKDRIGVLQPFRLSSGSTGTIKILFTRKGTAGDTKP